MLGGDDESEDCQRLEVGGSKEEHMRPRVTSAAECSPNPRPRSVGVEGLLTKSEQLRWVTLIRWIRRVIFIDTADKIDTPVLSYRQDQFPPTSMLTVQFNSCDPVPPLRGCGRDYSYMLTMRHAYPRVHMEEHLGQVARVSLTSGLVTPRSFLLIRAPPFINDSSSWLPAPFSPSPPGPAV